MNKKRIRIAATALLLAMSTALFAQQPKQIKVAEFSVSNITTIEERVFAVRTILDQGYYCYSNPNIENTIDVYVASDASDELSDFDFFYDNVVYERLNEYSFLTKEERGELFVEWRRGMDDEVFRTLYHDFTRNMASDNATCETAFPFCTDVGLYEFPAGTNSGSPCGDTYNASCSEPYKCSGTPGQSTYCLSTAPNPAFYYLRIDEPGNLNIYMHSTPQVDIDFDCWGPFDDINTACDQLACSNIVDCSYSTAANEYCHINNAQSGQFYILLITNFSNQTCNISFENIGTGTTDCSILPPLVNGGGPYCVGQTINLTAQNQAGATFRWTGPNGFSSNEQNPSIPNCTLEMAGVYDLDILGAISIKGTTREARFGNPTPRIAECEGGLINSVGLQNPGIDAVIAEELPALRKVFHKPIIANISGFSVDEYVECCARMDKEEQVEILEVNVSCPNVHNGGMAFGTSPEAAAEVTRAVKAVTRKPVTPDEKEIASNTRARSAKMRVAQRIMEEGE